MISRTKLILYCKFFMNMIILSRAYVSKVVHPLWNPLSHLIFYEGRRAPQKFLPKFTFPAPLTPIFPSNVGVRCYSHKQHELDSTSECDDAITDKMTKWVNNVVIGLNMCPFAEKSRSQKKIFTTIVRGDDVEEILSYILYESILREDDEGTALVVCPDLSRDSFVDFYDVVAMAEHMLQDQNLEGIIQIAPFHPLFEFEGNGPDAVDNLTNRAPYPVFHILREHEVEAAVKKLNGDSSKVWQRNISLLEKMEQHFGMETTKKIMAGEQVEGLKEFIRNMKFDDS